MNTLFPSGYPNPAPDLKLMVSTVYSKASKTRQDFEKALQKNKTLQHKLEYVKMLSLYTREQIHKILAGAEKKYTRSLFDELQALQNAYTNRLFKFTRKRRSTLGEIIFEKAVFLKDEFNMAEADPFIQLHKPDGYDEEMQEAKDEMEQDMRNQFGEDFDINDFDSDNPDFEKLYEKYADRFQQQNHQNRTGEPEQKRPKTKKQQEKEAAAKQAEDLLNADLQQLYRKLAIELHPDKEPNEALKAEKEEMMKMLSHARDENNILELLRIRAMVSGQNPELQKDIFSETTLKQLIRAVREQNRQLENKIFVIQEDTPAFNEIDFLHMKEEVMKKNILALIRHRKAQMENTCDGLKELAVLMSESNKFVNRYIDEWIEDQALSDLFDDYDFDDREELPW